MTFWQWLKAQKRRTDPVGDLSREAIADEAHKGNTRSWWERHLAQHNACDGAVDALDTAWEEFSGAK
ncbi:MAG: YozE family protein [Terriglobales bacterium]